MRNGFGKKTSRLVKKSNGTAQRTAAQRPQQRLSLSQTRHGGTKKKTIHSPIGRVNWKLKVGNRYFFLLAFFSATLLSACGVVVFSPFFPRCPPLTSRWIHH